MVRTAYSGGGRQEPLYPADLAIQIQTIKDNFELNLVQSTPAVN
jgi:hypothetical protein